MKECPSRALLVMPDEGERGRVRRLLESSLGEEAEILEAADAAQAEQMLSQGEFCAILIDYNLWESGSDLPGSAGLPDCAPALILLGEPSNAEAAVRAMKAGVCNHMRKALLSEEYLRAAIDSALEARKKQRRWEQADAAQRQENRALLDLVRELQQRTHQGELLNEMGAQLQICATLSDAYQSITLIADRLFPTSCGTLYILNGPRDLLDPVAGWGRTQHEAIIFAPQQCRALMRGRTHYLPDLNGGVRCQHVRPGTCRSSLCTSLAAQGQTLGVLVLQWQEDPVAGSPDLAGAVLAVQQLAEGLAEHAALGIANLRMRETLQIQSVRDPLTGLFNRRYMEETLEREVCSALRRGRPLSVMMIDLDHFKTFNDSFGHEVGDRVLRELGRFLQSRTRGEDVVCRYGGEEFVLILPEAALSDADKRADQLREEFKSLRYLTGVEKAATVTLSIGVAGFPDHGRVARDLLHHADQGLYLAKTSGRDRVLVAALPERERVGRAAISGAAPR